MHLVIDDSAVLPGGAQLDDRGVDQVNGVITPGLAVDLQPGQTASVNGSQEGICEIHGPLCLPGYTVLRTTFPAGAVRNGDPAAHICHPGQHARGLSLLNPGLAQILLSQPRILTCHRYAWASKRTYIYPHPPGG